MSLWSKSFAAAFCRRNCIMLQPGIAEFFERKKSNQQSDSINRDESLKNDDIFVQSMKRRLIECNADPNYITSTQIQKVSQLEQQPKEECSNMKCVSTYALFFADIK